MELSAWRLVKVLLKLLEHHVCGFAQEVDFLRKLKV